MIKLIDLNYYAHSDISDPEEVLELQKASIGFVDFIKEKLSIQLIKHMNYEGEKLVDGVKCNFFKSKNKFWYIPFKTHRYIKTQQPDIILIQGFIFPLQIIALRWSLGDKVKIILQHRGGKPFTGIKKKLQQLADRFINAYLFTGEENANEWIEKNIVAEKRKCHELLAASTYFKNKDKLKCKSTLSFNGPRNFLWIGRLNAGKDPMTVLKAFEEYGIQYPDARLYMIYQTEELLPEINNKLQQNEWLSHSVILKGRIDHSELETWYNAADFYISGSHKESCGFTLLEAMACGCIPIVTSIPSFRTITDDGRFGFLFEPGNDKTLLDILLNLKNIDQKKLSESIIDYFQKSLSFKSIADNLYGICKSLVPE